MITHSDFDGQPYRAIVASEELLERIYNKKRKTIKRINNIHVKLIRMLSICQKSEDFWQRLGDKLRKLKDLNQVIMGSTESLREELMSQIRHHRGCGEEFAQYSQQQKVVEQD